MKKTTVLVAIAFTLGLAWLAHAGTSDQPLDQTFTAQSDDPGADSPDRCPLASNDLTAESSTEPVVAAQLALDQTAESNAMAAQSCFICTSHAQCDGRCGPSGGVCLRAFGTCGYWYEKICACL